MGKIGLAGALGLACTAIAAGQQVAVVRATELQADFAVLRRAYEELHPGLYRYNTKEQMDAAFTDLAQRLNHDQPLQDAYLAFSVFAAKVKCGHTYANFFNQRKALAEQLFEGRTRVPFYFEWMDGRMVVTRDFSAGRNLPRGTEILRIDGVPVAEILSRLTTIARADGANDAKRTSLLAVTGDSIYETFDIYFPMFFPVKGGRLQLVARKPNSSKAEAINVAALTNEERIAPIKTREQARTKGDGVLFEWRYRADGSAVLRMPTWALYDSKWNWKGWLNARLDELAERSAPALIVDLRGNEGGEDVGNLVLSRLVKSDLRLNGGQRLVRYRKVPEDLLPYLDTWDKSFGDWGAAALDLAEPWPTAPAVRYFRVTKFDYAPEGDVLRAEGKPFTGRVFVLVDASNSSATFQFAQVVQRNKLGLLVGQPTGGNRRGINGGAFFFLRLPNSQIEMDLPLIGYFPARAEPDAGLKPDIAVVPRLDSVVNGTDQALEAVDLELRANKKKP